MISQHVTLAKLNRDKLSLIMEQFYRNLNVAVNGAILKNRVGNLISFGGVTKSAIPKVAIKIDIRLIICF